MAEQRPNISIRGFVRPSIGPSVRPSVRNPFLKYHGNYDFKTIKHQGTHWIVFLVEIQENSAKFQKIQQFIGRIVVRIELVLPLAVVEIPFKAILGNIYGKSKQL